MQKTVTAGMRNTTVTLDGTECAVKFSSNYKYFEVANESSGDVTASIYPEKSAGDDGTLTVHSGASATLAHMRNDISTVYLNGSGTVQIAAKNSGEAVFKSKAKGGESGGSGEKVMLSHTLTDYNAFKEWFDENVKPHIEDVFDIKYESPYGDAGSWLVWMPKKADLSAYFGGMQFYWQYLNLQAYYESGAHDREALSAGDTIYFKKTGRIIMFGAGENKPIYVYISSSPDAIISAEHWLGGLKWMN